MFQPLILINPSMHDHFQASAKWLDTEAWTGRSFKIVVNKLIGSDPMHTSVLVSHPCNHEQSTWLRESGLWNKWFWQKKVHIVMHADLLLQGDSPLSSRVCSKRKRQLHHLSPQMQVRSVHSLLSRMTWPFAQARAILVLADQDLDISFNETRLSTQKLSQDLHTIYLRFRRLPYTSLKQAIQIA